MTNMTDRPARQLLIITLAIPAIYVITQLFGSLFYAHGWSFDFLGVLPGWYPFVWVPAFPLLFLLLANLTRWEAQFKSRVTLAAGVVLLLVLLWFLRFDSFLYGGGNMRVAQLSQVETIIPQWFEWGVMTVVSALFAVVKSITPRANWASIYSWQILSFASTLAALAAAVVVVRMLATRTIMRLMLFLILFFGGQTAVYFGCIGVEPVIVAVTMWAFYFSVRLHEQKKILDLLLLWLLVAAGAVMHFSAAFLVPVGFYFTLTHLFRRKKQTLAATVVSLGSYLALLAAYYWHAASSFAFSRNALFFEGKPPFTDYGLFSYLHLVDWLQMLLLAFPLIVPTAYMLVTKSYDKKQSPLITGWTIAGLSGLTFVFITDPENSMALDLPRLVSYLTPLACLVTLLMSRFDYARPTDRRIFAVVATTAMLIPAAYLPSLVRVSVADRFVTEFLAQRDIYYRTTCLAFRDVYWTQREMDRADRWEALLPVKSIDYMNIRGCSYLVANGEHEEAEKRLYQAIAKLPYWTEPRLIAAQLQIKLGRFEKAKPQIDTCLMLEPNKKEHLSSLYSYYRDLPNSAEAIKTIDYMLTLFPSDPDIKTDQMIIMLRSGKPQVADSIAAYLLVDDSTRAYPYIIKGMIAENRRDTAGALRHYNTFLQYGALQPDTSFVRMRIEALTASAVSQ